MTDYYSELDVLNQAPSISPEQAQAERDAQAAALGIQTGLNEQDYLTAFQKRTTDPEWISERNAAQQAQNEAGAAAHRQYR